MTIQINEPGLYRLIFGSKLTFAGRFKDWVLHDVLPSIRKTGGYTIHNQLSIMNELDLHSNIVKYMRVYHPSIIIPGLGELQDTKGRRINSWKKGYQGGQPDLIVPRIHQKYSGFAIEFKTPKSCGKVNPNQITALERLSSQGYKTLVSSDQHEIIHFIEEYMRDACVLCGVCYRMFKSDSTLHAHVSHVSR